MRKTAPASGKSVTQIRPLNAILTLVGICLLGITVTCLLIKNQGLFLPRSLAYQSAGSAAFSVNELTVPLWEPDEGRIHINTATSEELTAIPGIGEKTAQNIIQERENGGLFYYPEDLMAVKGIGNAKMEQFLPYLTFCDD